MSAPALDKRRPHLGVIIPHYNTDTAVAGAEVRRVMSLARLFEGDVSVVAVDDGSTRRTRRSTPPKWAAANSIDRNSPLVHLINAFLEDDSLHGHGSHLLDERELVDYVPGVGYGYTIWLQDDQTGFRTSLTVLQQQNLGKARAIYNGALFLPRACRAVLTVDDDTFLGLGGNFALNRFVRYVAAPQDPPASAFQRQIAGVSPRIRASYSSKPWSIRTTHEPAIFLQNYKAAPALASTADRFYSLIDRMLVPLWSEGWNLWTPGAFTVYNYDALMKRRPNGDPGALESLANLNPRSGEDWLLAKYLLEDGYALRFDETTFAYTAPPLAHQAMVLQMYRWTLDFLDIVPAAEEMLRNAGEPALANHLFEIRDAILEIPICQWAAEDWADGARGEFNTRRGSLPERFRSMSDKDFESAVALNDRRIQSMLSGRFREPQNMEASRLEHEQALSRELERYAPIAQQWLESSERNPEPDIAD